MNSVYICDYVRTPFGRYGGGLSSIRADDLATIPLVALSARNPKIDLEEVDEVVLGCVNQAGEDNRNVARMALLLGGYPVSVPGLTVNRLCSSGMDAVIIAARAIQTGVADLMIAGGVESMSRSPFVMPKADKAFSRSSKIEDTTIGWRFVNPKMAEMHGVDAMGETAENVAEDFSVSREDQDLFAFWSQQKAERARQSGRLEKEIVEVQVPQRRGDAIKVDVDEHPRADTTVETLSKLRPPFRSGGTVTAGNASGVNDGAAAMVLASKSAMDKYSLEPIARIVCGVSAALPPRIMGYGPAKAIQKLVAKTKISLDDVTTFELNEAFASQVLASTRALEIEDNDPRVNPNGGAIALGHPLGASGARITGSAALELQQTSSPSGSLALASMCVGVGQGVAILLEKP